MEAKPDTLNATAPGQTSGRSGAPASGSSGGAAISSTDGINDIVIVSAFGRGNWLASELAGRGWQVVLVDVTESLGSWEPEDAEGPFGLFEATDLQPSQKTSLLDEGETHAVSGGFTVWLKEGPIECRSELTAFQLEKHGILKEVEDYLRHPGLPDKSSEKARRALTKLSFRETWLAQLAHQLTSPVIEENFRALETGLAAPIFTSFSIRQASAAGAQKGLKACQQAGARVRQKARINDVRLGHREINAIEIGDERAGVESGRLFVWMLSAFETQSFPESVSSTLFPRGAVEPAWFWARFVYNFEGGVENDMLPLHSVLIEDPFLPWTNANLLVLRKRTEGRAYDVWARLPIRARGESSYLQDTAAEIERRLAARLPLMKPKLVRLPTESRGGERRPRTPMIPLFEAGQRERLSRLKVNNLFYCGPEDRESLDWLGAYRPQNALIPKLEKLRAQWLAAIARQNARNAST